MSHNNTRQRAHTRQGNGEAVATREKALGFQNCDRLCFHKHALPTPKQGPDALEERRSNVLSKPEQDMRCNFIRAANMT